MRLIKRTIAFFIDYIIFVIPASIILLSLEFNGLLNIYIALIIFSTTYALLICRDIVGGQSIGKRLLKLKVITEGNHKEPKIWQHIVRSLFIPLWVVELIMLGFNSRKRIGDYVAKTEVVMRPLNRNKKIRIEQEHYIVVISIAATLFIIFLLLFLNSKAFRLYYV